MFWCLERLINYGILKKKEFYNKDDMKDIKIVEATTESGFKRNNFVYMILCLA